MTPLVTYSIGLLITVAVYGLAVVISGRRKPSDEAAELGITERDLRDFAGAVVAYDCDTSECITADEDAGYLRDQLSRKHPERRCHLVRIPVTPSGPIELLGVFGPSVSDNFHLDNVEGLR